MIRPLRGALPLLLAVAFIVAACGSDNPASPSGSARPSGSAAASAGASTLPSSGPSSSAAAAAPTVTAFWKGAARALSKSGRLRLVLSGNGTRELRFETKSSGAVADGALASVCSDGAAYTINGLRSTIIPGKWACGGSALVSAFRKSGQPVYAWNSRLPADTKIKERVSVVGRDRWQWDYVATSKILNGAVKTRLLMDAITGRLVSGSRTDPTGTTRYTFSYTTIFAPIAVP